MSFLFMPLLGIVVLLILLFLRRELIPRQIENEELRIENFGADGGEKLVTQESAIGGDAPAARPQPGASESESGVLNESALSENAEPGKVEQDPGRKASLARPQPDGEGGTENATPETREQDHGRDAPTARPQPDGEGAKPEARVVKEWPKFTLSGIAVGRERLAMLSSGEMLTAGEVAKCGVKVDKVDSASVVFSWRGETKTLRKGEQSDKPTDAPNAQENK